MNYEYYIRFESGKEIFHHTKDVMTVFDDIEKINAHEESEITLIKIISKK